MRTLLVTHYFPPEIGAPQARLSELARYWAAAGDEVTVLTGMPNHPTGVVPPEYRGRIRAVERVDGYRVVRTWLYATPNERHPAQDAVPPLVHGLERACSALRKAGRADVVVVSSPDVLLDPVGMGASPGSGGPSFVVEIRDLWPAIFVELGDAAPTAVLIRLLERLELAAYRAADQVVVVTEGFRDRPAARGVPAEQGPRRAQRRRRRRLRARQPRPRRAASGWARHRRRRLVLYAGAHGISHGLETVAEAAAKLTYEPVQFAFVGEGAAKAGLLDESPSSASGNVTTAAGRAPATRSPTCWPRPTSAWCRCATCRSSASFIPSKIFEYLAVGQGGGGQPCEASRPRSCAAAGRAWSCPRGPRRPGRRHPASWPPTPSAGPTMG